MNPQFALTDSASTHHIALADAQRSLSFAEAQLRVRKLSAALQREGVTAGTRVAVLSANSIEYVLLVIALQRCGASAALLNTRLHADDWRQHLQLSQAIALFYDTTHEQPDLHSQCYELSAFLAAADSLTSTDLEAYPDCEFDPAREAAVIFTSGSSGQAKGVRLSLGNFYASAYGSNEITGLASGDTWLVALPLYHLGGLGIVYRTLYAGARAFFAETFSDEALCACLNDQHITHLSLVPTQLGMLMDQGGIPALQRLKAIVLAGAPSSPALLDRIAALKLPVLSAYGMTETTAHCCCMRLDDPIALCSGVGRAFAHTDIEAVDEQRQPVAPGAVGEIRFRGPTVCLGYLIDGGAPPVGEWLYSGDLGYFDVAGNLRIVGRADAMFISGGENIQPVEIEQAALTHPAVQRAAVVAVADAKWGQRPLLFVELKPGCHIETKALKTHLRERIARIKVPDSIVQLPTMPLTAIGKADYPALRILAAQPASEPSPA